MTPFYQDDAVTLYLGDSFDVLKSMPDASVDALVSDPPYGIGFMGKEWDSFKPGKEAARIVPNKAIASDNPNLKGRTRGPASSPSAVEYDYSVKGLRQFQEWTEGWAREVLRVLKPGGHAVVCGAPRAYHRMASGLEDAGFEIRDCLAWLFGSGFPKSLNLVEGLGTALKPAHEPIVLARKPFKGTVRANVERFGTGALNVDACRVESVGESLNGGHVSSRSDAWDRPWKDDPEAVGRARERWAAAVAKAQDLGRWPANVVLDEIAALVLDEQSGELVSGSYSGERHTDKTRNVSGAFTGTRAEEGHDGSIGGASRFFYVAKPSREERDYGTRGMPTKDNCDISGRTPAGAGLNSPRAGALRTSRAGNFHPTVKPVELMRWLVKLVTPVGGVVLDPFLGSGTTGMACKYEQRRFIGIEREAEYMAIAERRIQAVAPLFTVAPTVEATAIDRERDLFAGVDPS